MTAFRTLLRSVALAALAATATAQAHASSGGEAAAETVVVYRGATLIDGTGAAARTGLSIVTRGARIAAVQPDAAPTPAGAEMVDVSGLHVLPGLIDTHVHIATPPDAVAARAYLRRWLYSGVTSVRSMADDLRSVGELARQARVGEIPAPDIHYAALMGGASFFEDPRTQAVTAGRTAGQTPWMQALTDDTDLATAVTLARGTSASGIKLYADLPAHLVRQVTAEAHRQGIPVWAHAAVYPAMPAEIAAAGVDVMSHACSLAHQGQSPRERPSSYASRTPIEPAPFLDGKNPAVDAVLDEMRERNIILDATIRVYVEQARQAAKDAERKKPNCSGALAITLTRQAFEAGVAISTGTDGKTDWQDGWPALHEEMELLADEVGMPSLQVIRSATQIAARALGLGDEVGTIESGKLANLVFVSADPAMDISNLRSVVFTVRRGVPFRRDAYQPIAAGEVGRTGR